MYWYIILIISIILLIISIYRWINEIINESSLTGGHTKFVMNNLLTGYILFIISEITIFICLFIGYFYNNLIPSIEIGCIWPPIGINILNPFSIPLYNTILLYISGITITISQNYIFYRYKSYTIYYILITILLGSIFTYLQYIEYIYSTFSIYDSIFSSNFYILTGFHGIHVLIGSFLLIISLLRLYISHYTINHNIGMTTSIIYWHFVDYIWIILYIIIYCIII